MRWLRAAALCAALAACQTTASTGEFSLGEFYVDGPQRLSAGQQEITARNEGEFPHTLVITTASGEVVGATGLIQPGEVLALPVEVAAGDYLFTCRIVAQNDQGGIVDHFAEGMSRAVRVEG